MQKSNPVSINSQEGAVHQAPRQTKRGLSMPLVLLGFLAVALGAYFLGRGAAAPAPSASPAATTGVGHEGKEHAEGEGHGEGEGHADGEEGHGGLIKLDPAAAKTAGIRVEPARYGLSQDVLSVPGTVEVSPKQGARITPPVPAKVVRILVDRGQSVRAGQPLVILDSVEVAEAHAAVRQAQSGVQQARAGVQTAQARVQQTRTRLESAQSALARQRQLAQTGAFSQPSLQAAQNELNEAQAELTQAQTALQAQTTILQRTERLFKEQLVARAELEQAQTARRQEETRLEQAKKRVAIAEQALLREQKVFRGGLLSRQAIQTAEAEVRAAQGDVRQAQKEEEAARTALTGAHTSLSVAGANLHAVEGEGHSEGGAGRLTLYAPIGGTVIDLHATQGQAVERATELFEIENLSSVLVEANVPEGDVARVRVGQRAEITVPSYAGMRFPGVVQSLGSRVDEKTRTLPVRVLVQNPGGRLRPEMFARVSLGVGSRASSVMVPASAIGEDGVERFVFVAENGGYERRAVRVGKTNGSTVEVLNGVRPGEPVVTQGVFVLKSEAVKSELKGHEH